MLYPAGLALVGQFKTGTGVLDETMLEDEVGIIESGPYREFHLRSFLESSDEIGHVVII